MRLVIGFYRNENSIEKKRNKRSALQSEKYQLQLKDTGGGGEAEERDKSYSTLYKVK